MNLTHIIKRPIITEKSLNQTSLDRFSFIVASKATKNEIKQAIEAFFNVNVVNIRTSKIAGKRYRQSRRRQEKIAPDQKKAVIELKKGQKIDLFEAETKEK